MASLTKVVMNDAEVAALADQARGHYWTCKGGPLTPWRGLMLETKQAWISTTELIILSTLERILSGQLSTHEAGQSFHLAEDLRLIRWAYNKLHHLSFSKQEDALMLDEMKLLLMTEGGE